MATKERQVVLSDRWDDSAYEEATEQVPPMKRAGDTLSEANWTGNRLVKDVFSSMLKARPQLRPGPDLDASYRVNRQVMSELMDDETWRTVRQHTMGDSFASGLATATMAEYLAEMYQRLTEAQEKADQASKSQQAFDDACENGASPAELDDLAKVADFDSAAADQAIDQAAPMIGKAVREGTQAAGEQADKIADSSRGWGLGPGDLQKVPPESRMELAARLTDERMMQIAAMFGRLRSESWAVSTNRFERGPDEIHGITLSDDIGRIIGAEMVNLAVPELEVGLLDRYTRKQLQTYNLRKVVKEAKGSIIYVEDSSASMDGTPEIWARAVGLALLNVAKIQKRGFRAILFADVDDDMMEFDFGLDASESTFEDMLRYAESRIMGGTSFEAPLHKAAEYLAAEHAVNGRTTADVVFATDGVSGIGQKWLDQFKSEQARLGFRVFGISIAHGISTAMKRVCDVSTEVRKLTDGSEITAMFREVTAPKEAA